MANTVSMRAPNGWSGGVSVNRSTPPSSGQTYNVPASGMILVDPLDVGALVAWGFVTRSYPTDVIKTANDNGTTQTLTAAMIAGANGGAADLVVHQSTGGTTPSLTLPLAADLAAAIPNMAINDTFVLRIINTNSGTATIVTNTGWTLTGTLTLATNTTRDFLVTKTGAATFTAVSIGTGTTS